MIDIGAIIDSCFEIHKHKFNKNISILILDFFRCPEIVATIQLIMDSGTNSTLSPLYKRRIFRDKKGFFFKLDSEKYYLKHNIV